MDANELRFAFDSDSAHARDHVVIPFPEINEIPEGGLSFRVETSYDLAKWKEMHTIHFELSSETQIQGSFMKDILRVDPDTRNFNFLWLRSESIYPDLPFLFPGIDIGIGAETNTFEFQHTEALSYVSYDTEEIYIFIGDYDIVNATLTLIGVDTYSVEYALEYTQRAQQKFFRVVPRPTITPSDWAWTNWPRSIDFRT